MLQFEHIEIFVSNRESAAKWYASVFGFNIVEKFRDWSLEKSGPLMIPADGEREMIAMQLPLIKWLTELTTLSLADSSEDQNTTHSSGTQHLTPSISPLTF